MLHDVFICHAREDKDDFVRPLAEALRAHYLDVWYDEFTLRIGDSLREAIDRGLADSRFGITVLSQHFFQRRWPQRELNGLVAREIAEERQLVLPIWHRIDRQEILKYSPPLADVFAVSSARGIEAVVNELLKKLRPEESPLIVARDFLISKGVPPPIVTDEWWLDLVEIKEAQLRFPDLNVGRRWIFPLPFPEADRGKKRGLNIAWTALQMDWASDGEERNLCQLTIPSGCTSFCGNGLACWNAAGPILGCSLCTLRNSQSPASTMVSPTCLTNSWTLPVMTPTRYRDTVAVRRPRTGGSRFAGN